MSGKPIKAQPDWERIELEYRAGIKTLRQIAGENGISHVAIAKRAKRDEWSRDLSAKIHAKAEELVTKQMVNSEVTKEAKIAEKQVIEINAQAVASVRLAHRTDVQRSRKIVMALLSELELETGPETVNLLERLGELMRREDDKGVDKLNDLYQKIISLPGRAKTMKDLGESLRVLVGLEREAFGMDAKTPQQQDDDERVLSDAERAAKVAALLEVARIRRNAVDA